MPQTSKKLYKEFAELLKHYKKIEALPIGPEYTDLIPSLIEEIADIFAKDNPRFNKDTFLKACGIQINEIS